MSGAHNESILAHLQRGAFDTAIELAQQALSEQPDDPELYELLAAAYYESGQLERCAAVLRQQLARMPDNTQALGNLGQVLLDLGEIDAAMQHCERAVALDPGSAEAINALGNVYRATNRLEQALQQYQKANEIQPENPQLVFNIGAVLAALRRYREAEQHLASVIAIAPDYIEAINHYALVLKQLGRVQEAIHHYQRSLSIDANRPDTLNNLGACWMDLQKQDKAREAFEKSIAADPNYAGAFVNLAVLAEDQNDLVAALEYYAKASAAQPANDTIYSNLGALYLRLGRSDEALDAFRTALHYGPNNALAHAGLADTYRTIRNNQSAQEELDKATILAPDSGYVFEVKARLLEAQGDIDGAADAYQCAIELETGRISARFGLALFYTRQGQYDRAEQLFSSLVDSGDANVLLNWAAMEEKRNRVTRARELLAQAKTVPGVDNAAATVLASRLYLRDKRYSRALAVLDAIEPDSIQKLELKKDLLFQRGRVLDKLGRFEEAFESFRLANEQSRRRLGSAGAKPLWDTYPEYETIWSKVDRPTSRKQKDRKPIFIVGFPRSGTTLLEQIVSSHPKVTAGDELITVYELVEREARRILGSSVSYPACLLASNTADWAKLRAYYLQRAQTLVPGASESFTDKMPLNLAQLGLIHLMFPDAPIIHVVRHPLDACLSTYFSNFAHLPFACDLEAIARQYDRVMQLSTFYQETFNLRYLELRYEDLLIDLEPSIRRVLAHIGQAWDPACLKFFDNKRVANTESYAQVTEAIYTQSRYRYKNYAGQLRQLVSTLQPAISRFGYEVEL